MMNKTVSTQKIQYRRLKQSVKLFHIKSAQSAGCRVDFLTPKDYQTISRCLPRIQKENKAIR